MKTYRIIGILRTFKNKPISLVKELAQIEFNKSNNQDLTLIESNKRLKGVLNEYMNRIMGESTDNLNVFVLVFCDEKYIGLFKLYREIEIENNFKIIDNGILL